MSPTTKAPPKGPIAWMARNSVAANLAMLLILVGGLMGVSRIKQEVFPEFDLDVVIVSVPYPGASPAEVEQGIVLAIEEKARGIDGVKRVYGRASEGVGAVTIELLVGADRQKALADVKASVDRIQSFPEDAEDPNVALASRRREVVSLVAAGDLDLPALYALGEKMRAELLERGGVTQADVFGIPEPEIAIEIDRSTLQSYGLTLDAVAAQVRASSLEVPGGGVDTSGGEILVRVADRRLTGDEFADLVLRSSATGAEVRLGDIATIRDGFAETDQASVYNGRPAVRLTAYRVGEETPTGVADALKAYQADLRAELPDSIDLAVWNDDSELLRQRIDLLVRNAFLGMILVLIILALLLEARLAFWVGLGIPISFLGAFLLMPMADVSINMISLFALIVTLGMVVDDAIVIGENIYTKQQEGMDELEAAIEGAQEMAVPVSFAILTTAAAFAPMLFIPGTSGKMFMIIPMVVLAVLFFSLLESFLILPAHLAHSSDRESSAKGVFGYALYLLDQPRIRVAGALDRFIEKSYRPALQFVLRHRYPALAVAVAMFLIAVGATRTGLVPFSFLPGVEGDVVKVSAKLPYGAPVASTQAIRAELEDTLQELIEDNGYGGLITGVFTRVGEGPPGQDGSREVASHLLSLEVEMVPVDERPFTAGDLTRMWEEALPEMPGLQSLTFSFSVGPFGGAAVDVQLSHADMDVLADASGEVAELLRGFDILTGIENSWASGKPQVDYHLTSHGTSLGLTANDVARQIRASFFGSEAIREQRGRHEMKVMVRLPASERGSEYDLEELDIRTPTGAWVPLSYVADQERRRSPTAITREDGRPVVDVVAELVSGTPSSRVVIEALQQDEFPKLRERYPGLEVSLVGEQRNQAESLASLGRNYFIAVFVIFALLAIPFKSYTQPIIIMSAIPFGFVGAILGHVVMGYGLSIISVMGIIALSGVVVNDSLVLVDASNQAISRGMSPREAIAWAGRRRFRPILLTSLTTFFGLLPMIFEPSVQARFLIPMAISLGYGVLFATVIVLLIVPALYMVLEDAKGLVAGEPAPEPALPIAKQPVT